MQTNLKIFQRVAWCVGQHRDLVRQSAGSVFAIFVYLRPGFCASVVFKGLNLIVNFHIV